MRSYLTTQIFLPNVTAGSRLPSLMGACVLHFFTSKAFAAAFDSIFSLGGQEFLCPGKCRFSFVVLDIESLERKKFPTLDHLVAYGNSAGGLVVGWATNEYPELFNTAILDHPYLDVTNTMMNDSLVITVDDYK